MAIKLNLEQENYALKKYLGNNYSTQSSLSFYHKLNNQFLRFLKNVKTKQIIYKNQLIKSFYKIKKLDKEHQDIEFKISMSNEKILEFSEILHDQKFLFIENFLPEKNHQALINNWPEKFFFEPMGKIIKEYNWGFRCKGRLDETIQKNQDLKKNPIMKKFYSFINSVDFSIFLNNLFKNNSKEYFLFSILATTAGQNSFLIPHVDNVQKTKRKNTYNCIYFVDGDDKDLDRAGATSIYKDNNFKELIFQPTSLKNSLLIYESTHDFFHGFKTTREGIVERKTINYAFHPKFE